MSSASGDDLFSRILAAFHEACFVRDLEVGRRLLQIAATFHFGRTDLTRRQREDGLLRLMYCHDRLWHLMRCIHHESTPMPVGLSSNVRILPVRSSSIALRLIDPSSAIALRRPSQS